jgi:LAS superfamily LD-carboxypeptidase LdcB
MPSITRRNFIHALLGGLVLAGLPQPARADDITYTVGLPAVDSLENPLLIRIVDSKHLFTEKDIKKKVEPHLQKIPLSMDGILAANENVRIHDLALPALQEMFAASNADQTGLYIHSGFRSYEEQAIAYSNANDKSVVLKPGQSQHHTGLAADFTSSEIGKIIDVNSGFQKTKAGKWLKKNAPSYGFVQSYTGSHDDIQAESWHYLYVGLPLADAYTALKKIGWYGDVFTLQMAMNLGMSLITVPAEDAANAATAQE